MFTKTQSKHKKFFKVAGKGGSFEYGFLRVCKFGVVSGLRLYLFLVNTLDGLQHQTQFLIVHAGEYALDLRFLSPYC